MSKDNEFDQFKGQGVKYAPKPAPKPAEPAEPFEATAAPDTESEEDKMRDVLMNERHLRRMGNQHRMDQ